MITYKLHHPQLSEPLEMDAEIERRPDFLKAWAQMYILRTFDVMVDRTEWTIEQVA
jgi:hypothetical protein